MTPKQAETIASQLNDSVASALKKHMFCKLTEDRIRLIVTDLAPLVGSTAAALAPVQAKVLRDLVLKADDLVEALCVAGGSPPGEMDDYTDARALAVAAGHVEPIAMGRPWPL